MFDAAHRLLNHSGKCRHLHGHRYVAEVTITADYLDGSGMVIDFGIIKNAVGGFINDFLDHNIILSKFDPLLACWSNPALVSFKRSIRCADVLGDREPFIMPNSWAPTAERIAQVIYDVAKDRLEGADERLTVTKVRLWETENCFAEYAG